MKVWVLVKLRRKTSWFLAADNGLILELLKKRPCLMSLCVSGPPTSPFCVAGTSQCTSLTISYGGRFVLHTRYGIHERPQFRF